MHEDFHEADTRLKFLIEKATSREKWNFTERLGLFSKNIRIQSDYDKNKILLYYCEALKMQSKGEELKKEIEIFNCIENPMFFAALCALKNDKDGFYTQIKKAAAVEKIEKNDLFDFREWPVFNEFRRDENYKTNIEKIFDMRKELNAK